MKINLPDTLIGRNSNIIDYARNARVFLLDNVDTITFSHDELQKLLQTHDMMSKTVMSELYQQALVNDKLTIFSLLKLNNIAKIPSWFLISWLDIDTLELIDIDKHSADILNTMPQYREKILCDITPYYSPVKGVITDTTGYYSRIVRNMLCRSYHLSGSMWLSPTLIYLLTKFFSMILSVKLGRTYNLTYQEQMVIATILSVYFVNRCSDIPEVINPMMGKMDFLQRVVDVKSVYAYISEKYDVKTFDLDAVVNTIIALSPARMGKFTTSTLCSMNANLTSNQLISLISLEYPPYWCHLILSSLSGDKTNMYHTIKMLNMKKETMEFQSEILKTSTFVRSLA